MDAANGETKSPSRLLSSSLSSPSPESFFVFVVGHCEEWPENRDDQGDEAIYKEYIDFGVPEDQCVYVKDDDCTRKNCQEQLEIFLTKSSSQTQQLQLRKNSGNIEERVKIAPPTTLIFHYGGHGSANGFGTIGGTWEYQQVAQTIERLFRGDRVLFLLDCCAAGNLWRHLPSSSSSSSNENHTDTNNSIKDTTNSTDNTNTNTNTSNTNYTRTKQYVLLATSQPYITSSAEGDEWILTNSWILLMRRRRRHNNNNNNGDNGNTDTDDDLSMEDLISLLADRLAFELGDTFFAYLTTPMSSRNNPWIDWSWMPARCRQRQRQRQISAVEEEEKSSSSSSPIWLPSSELSLSDRRSKSSISRSRSSSSEYYQMPKAGKILSIHDCRVGDAIAYKHPGGYPLSVTTASSNSSISSTVKQLPLPLPFYVPPLWLNATIVSISEKHRNQEENETTDHSDSILVRIRVKYPSQDEPWEVDVSSYRHQLMNHFWVVQTWMLPRAFCKTQVMLAQKYLQYLDCSVAANTPVRVVTLRQQEAGGDGDDDDAVHDHDHNDVDRLTTREGTILDWKDFDWKHIFDSNKSDADGFTLSIKTDYDSYYWDELPVPVKTAALAFGYTKSYWDDDIDIPADSKDSDELTEAQKEAATVLGYVRQKLVVSEITSTSPGAHVPVQWNDNHQSSSLVPLSQLVFPDTRKYNLPSNVSTTTSSSSAAAATAEMLTLAMTKQADDDEKLESLQRQSLIRALESSGKSIGNAESILGTTELSAFWPDNDEWYDATPIDIVQEETNSSNSNSNSNNKLSLKLLATHFEYQLPGIYCPIMYEDGVRHLIPLNYIFKRGRQPQQQEGDDDQSSTEEASSPTTSLPTEEAIDDLSASLLDISLKTASFGEHFSEVASKIEEASKLIHAAFEKKNKDDQHKQEQGQPGEANTDISSSSTTNTNSTEPSSKIYIEDDWSDLPEHVKNAARSIGYNKKLWDTSDEDIPDKEWKDLTLAEKGALEIIGYKEAEWQKDDSEDDSDDDDSDDDY